MSEPVIASLASQPVPIETPGPVSGAKGSFADNDGPSGEETAQEDVREAELIRRRGAKWAAIVGTFGFSALVTCELIMTAFGEPPSVQTAAWRAAVAISGAVFSYGLLRIAERLSTPLDMLVRVDLERARQRQGVSAKDLTAALSALSDAIGKIGK